LHAPPHVRRDSPSPVSATSSREFAGGFDSLAEPQRRALRVALALEDAGGAVVEERVVALAFLNLLRALSQERPVVVAVDDLQWLDRSSAAALEFAARRLDGERVRFLVSRRTGEGATPKLPGPVVVLRVGPLSLGALQRLLGERVELSMPRQTLRRVWEISGGNPFYALELAHALARRGDRVPSADVPIPTDLSALLQERLATLPPETRRTLLAAALVADPPPALLDAVDGAGAVELLLRAGTT
jgi:predicted ATPase